jgi:Zn-dependent membrane protease YugP
MIILIIILLVVMLIYGPNFWVRYVIRKHSKPLEGMPGTGSELAQHLIERYQLEGVTIKETSKDEDYYSPDEKMVGLSPEVYHGKSLAAIAIAAHEVGHAIQYHNNEAVSRLRQRYAVPARSLQAVGVGILSLSPILGMVLRTPSLMIITLAIGVIAMLAAVVMNALVLPLEYDASFAKALPILQDGYVPEEYLPAITQVLRACAFTYVAAALADIVNIWRWIAILR